METMRKIFAFSCALMLCLSLTGTGTLAESTDREPYTVKMVFPGDATTEATNEVAAAASKILQEKYNTTLEIVRIGYGSFQQEVNLMLSSGEKLDLMPNFAFSVTTAANSGQILDLDDLLKEYGGDMYAQVSEADWACVKVDGKIYAVPNNKEKAQGYGIAMVSSVLDALNYDVSNLKTEDDLTELFRLVKENYPDMYPLVSDNGEMGYSFNRRDDLGGDYGVLEDCFTDSTTVVNWTETDTYRKIIEQRYAWAQEGLIMPDASTNTENAYSLMAAGKGFAYFTNTKPGIANEWERKAGVPITVVEFVEPFSTTSGVANQWFIVHNSEKPERAMEVLNEMYTNPELADILINGIEGEHYVKDTVNGVLRYPEGVDASNTTYSSVAWAWLNELISTPWEADGPDIWKETLAFNESAHNSIAKGFMWNNSNVLNEITACNNVKAKYQNALECGSLDPAEALTRYNQELKDAGVDRIVAEKQAQLDAWLADQQ